MARQQANQGKQRDDEDITVLSDQEPADVPLEPVNDAERSVVVADATQKTLETAPPAEEVPVVKRYVVVKGGSVLVNGHRTTIKEGKIVDNLNYDLTHLQKQGIRLQREETSNYGLVD